MPAKNVVISIGETYVRIALCDVESSVVTDLKIEAIVNAVHCENCTSWVHIVSYGVGR